MSDPNFDDSLVAESLHLLDLSRESGRAYKKTQLLNDLNQSILYAENGLHAADHNAKQRAACLWQLSYRIQQRYDRLHSLADLQKAIQLRQQYHDVAPSDDSDLLLSYGLLSGLFEDLFNYSNNHGDLQTAISWARKAVAHSSITQEEHIIALGELDRRLDLWFEVQGGRLSILEERITLKASLCEEQHLKQSQRLHYLDALGYCWRQKFSLTSNIDDIDESIRIARQALSSAPSNHEERFLLLTHLSASISQKWTASPATYPEGLEESVRILKEGIGLCPENSSKRPAFLSELMNRYRDIYQATGDLHELEAAVGYGRECVLTTAEGSPELPMRIQDFAICLRHKFEATGEIADLDEAISSYRSALSLEKRRTDQAMVCNNLNFALQERYDFTAAVADLKEAVQQGSSAVALTSEVDSMPLTYANNLANAFSKLYRRLKHPNDLADAITWARKVVSLVPAASPDRASYINNLGCKVWSRFEATGSLVDREEALQLARMAVELALATDSDRPKYIKNLGDQLYSRWLKAPPEEKTKEMLDESIDLAKECLSLLPKAHVDWAEFTTSLAWRLTKRMEQWEELDEVIATFQSAFENQSGRPLTRVEAGRAAGLFLMFKDKWDEAFQLYQGTLDLLGRVSPRSVPRDDMQNRLSGVSNISTFAAGACLRVGGAPGEALAILERGRGIILTLCMNLRSDVTHLASSYPSLYAEFEQIRNALFGPEASINVYEDLVLHRRQLEEKLRNIENEIRTKPGFDCFQLAPSADQLRELGSFGPLVCFNVTKWRSDAFIVTSKKVEVLPLPSLNETSLGIHVKKIVGPDRLTKCSPLKRAANNKTLRKILKWLWQVAVKPVLEHLDLRGPSSTGSNLPRIWWISSGPMGLMPLHAAGLQWNKGIENTASRAVSSYSPTFRALAYSRERSQSAMRQARFPNSKMLIVPMPSTPEDGWPSLNTGAEIAAISRGTSSPATVIKVLEHPIPETVLSEIRQHSIVHFACHGDPNIKDPAQTSLVLWKNSHQADRLTVGSLFDEDLQHAQLAYLSACCTAQQYAMDLIDESIHLGSLFQLMGFPAVIATLWEAGDEAAATVAGAFYGQFLKEIEQGRAASDCAARCLHSATQYARKLKRGRGHPSDDVIAWAPFIHIGA